MKKILVILILTLSLLTSCRNSHRVIGDEYIVTCVEDHQENVYQTKYKVIAISTNDHANFDTIAGNEMVYYTNTFYSVGDTIRLSNSKMK